MTQCLSCSFTLIGKEVKACLWCKSVYCEDCIGRECIERNKIVICNDCNEVELGAKFDEISLNSNGFVL